MTCPKCGANLQVPGDRAACFCTYCGAQLLVDDGSTTVTYRTVDEARIRELEVKSALEMKQLEIEERRRPGKIKASITLAIVGAVMLIAGFFFGEGAGNGNIAWYMVAMLGYFPLFAIPFIWISGSDGDDRDG